MTDKSLAPLEEIGPDLLGPTRIRMWPALIVIAALIGCGGGGGGGGGPSPTPTPTATATATSTPLTLVTNPTAVAVNGLGAANAQPLTVSESAYTGAITESDTCAGIATVSPGSGVGPSLSETVTGVAAGNCVATFKDINGETASSTIQVTTSGVVIQSRAREH
jgi:hypothetical protein